MNILKKNRKHLILGWKAMGKTIQRKRGKNQKMLEAGDWELGRLAQLGLAQLFDRRADPAAGHCGRGAQQQ